MIQANLNKYFDLVKVLLDIYLLNYFIEDCLNLSKIIGDLHRLLGKIEPSANLIYTIIYGTL